MARRKSNFPLVAAFVGLVAVMGAGAVWLFVKGGASGGVGPAVATAAPPLPAGKLLQVDSHLAEARYVALDDTKKTGTTAQATVLIVGTGPKAVSDRYAFLVKRETVNCAARQIRDEVAGEYDAAGKLANSEILSSSLGRPATPADAEAPVVCAASPPAGLRTAIGYKAAQRDVQSPPETLIAQADAAPRDPDLAAWVCAAGARGRWNPSLPKQCDHAVELNPTSAAVVVDRGFLKLVLGKNPAADADFQKAATIDPQSAGGLFGHSLVMAMRGDLEAARKIRDRALDLDPKVADWIEQTYRFQITDKYRGR
jgi:tetratricopeptide (TPR) repeat protein